MSDATPNGYTDELDNIEANFRSEIRKYMDNNGGEMPPVCFLVAKAATIDRRYYHTPVTLCECASRAISWALDHMAQRDPMIVDGRPVSSANVYSRPGDYNGSYFIMQGTHPEHYMNVRLGFISQWDTGKWVSYIGVSEKQMSESKAEHTNYYEALAHVLSVAGIHPATSPDYMAYAAWVAYPKGYSFTECTNDHLCRCPRCNPDVPDYLQEID